jgi:hypothetical protein
VAAGKLCGASRCRPQKVPEVVELKVEYPLDVISTRRNSKQEV